MQRKKLHTKKTLVLTLCGLCYYGSGAFAQGTTVSINLPQANIQGRTDYTSLISAGTYNSVISVLPSFSVKANAPTFSSTTSGTFPASLVHMRLASIGALTLLNLGGNNEVALSTTSGVLYTALASVSSGAITANARIATSSQTWVAGVYTNVVSFSTQGILAGSITPANFTLSITVPSFISPPSNVGTTNILVNDLNFYRSANGITGNQIIPISSTVPYIPSIRANSSQFSFSTSLPYNNLPVTPVSAISSTLSGIATATTSNLTNSDQALTSATGIAVPTNNSSSITHTYSISPAQLKSNFIQAGTYAVPLTYTWNKLSSAYPSTPLQVQSTGNLSIVVSDLGELIANQSSVNLNFANTGNYRNGVSVDIANHLRVSKTTPYNLYVRASSSNFLSGANTIPLNVLRIGPTAGQTGINTITLSSTAQQLIQNANPTIDRNLNIQYSIPASETSKLLGKPSGSYTATIIYSFVAP